MNTADLKPGLYPGLSRETYDGIPAINFSVLKHVKRSPAHARHVQLNPEPPTPAQELGTLVHAYLLEPDRFAREWIELPDLTANLKTKDGEPAKNPTATAEYKQRLSEFGAAHPGKRFLSPEQMAMLRGIGEGLSACAEAAGHLQHPSANEAEVALVWRDPQTGLGCKGLIDVINDRDVIDLKTTDNASPAAFARQCVTGCYALQAAWYMWGLSVIGRPATQFFHVAVESSAPFGVAMYELDDPSLDQGLRENRAYLDSWARCVESGHWPAYPATVQPLSLPRYALNDIGV